jgi:hypothetical protein
LPEDGFAQRLLLESDAFPSDWWPLEPQTAASTDLAICTEAPPAGRTGRAMTPRFMNPDGTEGLREYVDVFDNAEDAQAYLGLESKTAQCQAQVVNAGKANDDSYSFDMATFQPLNLPVPSFTPTAYRLSFLVGHSEAEFVSETQDWVCVRADRIVISLYHASIVGAPDSAVTSEYVAKALAKVQSDAPSRPATPSS